MVIRVCLNKWTTDIVRIVFRLWANSTYRGWESKPHWFVGNWHEKTQTLRLESHWNDVFNHNFLGWTNVIILYNIIHHVSLILYLFFFFCYNHGCVCGTITKAPDPSCEPVHPRPLVPWRGTVFDVWLHWIPVDSLIFWGLKHPL